MIANEVRDVSNSVRLFARGFGSKVELRTEVLQVADLMPDFESKTKIRTGNEGRDTDTNSKPVRQVRNRDQKPNLESEAQQKAQFYAHWMRYREQAKERLAPTKSRASA